MNTNDMQHGTDWTGQDLSGWTATEKFDGCRVYWDGSSLWSRGGIDITIPPMWREALPAGQALDCELMPRKQAEQFIRRGKWCEDLGLMAFDAPMTSGDYLARMATIERNWLVEPVKVWTVASTGEAIVRMRAIQSTGGEGLMLRHPGIQYHPGRSSHLLKLKSEVIL
jgi:DNA ligase-1